VANWNVQWGVEGVEEKGQNLMDEVNIDDVLRGITHKGKPPVSKHDC